MLATCSCPFVGFVISGKHAQAASMNHSANSRPLYDMCIQQQLFRGFLHFDVLVPLSKQHRQPQWIRIASTALIDLHWRWMSPHEMSSGALLLDSVVHTRCPPLGCEYPQLHLLCSAA